MTAIYSEAQQIVYWLLSIMVVYMALYVIDLRLYHTWRPVWGAPGWVMMLMWAIGLFVASGGAWIIQDESATVALTNGWVYTLTLFVVVLGMLFIWPFVTAAANDDNRLWVAWVAAAWLALAFVLQVWAMVKTTVSYSTAGGWLMFPLELFLLYFVSVAFGGAYRMTYKEPRELTEDGIDRAEYGFYDAPRDNNARERNLDKRRRKKPQTNRTRRGARRTPGRKSNRFEPRRANGTRYDSAIEFP